MPTIVRSSQWVARTTAGLSLAVVRSVNGNLTRTTSPGWTVGGIEVWFAQPFSESGLPQTHPFPDLKPIGDFREDHLELFRPKLAEELNKLFRWDLKPAHESFSLYEECINGSQYRSIAAPLTRARRPASSTGAPASPPTKPSDLAGEPPEGSLPSGSKPVDQEVGVKGEGLVNAEPLHHGERGAVDEAEGLIGEGLGDMPRGLEIHRALRPTLTGGLPLSESGFLSVVRSR